MLTAVWLVEAPANVPPSIRILPEVVERVVLDNATEEAGALTFRRPVPVFFSVESDMTTPPLTALTTKSPPVDWMSALEMPTSSALVVVLPMVMPLAASLTGGSVLRDSMETPPPPLVIVRLPLLAMAELVPPLCLMTTPLPSPAVLPVRVMGALRS